MSPPLPLPTALPAHVKLMACPSCGRRGHVPATTAPGARCRCPACCAVFPFLESFPLAEEIELSPLPRSGPLPPAPAPPVPSRPARPLELFGRIFGWFLLAFALVTLLDVLRLLVLLLAVVLDPADQYAARTRSYLGTRVTAEFGLAVLSALFALWTWLAVDIARSLRLRSRPIATDLNPPFT